MKTLSILSLFFILFGCGSGRQTEITENTAVIDTAELDGTVTDSSEPIESTDSELSKKSKTFKGLYISGNEVSTFRSCDNPENIYWVEDESKKLASSYKKATSFLSYPYESILIEFTGYLKGKSNIGYAGEYDNVLVVTDVITAKQKSFNTDCFAYEFIALGNEPFWAVEIIPEEKIITLKDVGIEKTYIYPYKAAKVVGNTFTYEVANDRKQSIKVVITKETCSDGMSDRKYNYSALVIINGKTLNGCAIKKGDKVAMNQ